MPQPFRPLSVSKFLADVECFDWQRRIWRVDMHHTFNPDHARWRQIGSSACVDGMWRHHTRERGFSDIAQHVSIMPDGVIWSGRDWNSTPASVGFGMNRGVFMLEAVGNFDIGVDRLEGEQLNATIAVIRGIQQRFRLPVEALLFHREVPQTDKTCPGTSITKSDVLSLLRGSPVRLSHVHRLERLPLERTVQQVTGQMRA